MKKSLSHIANERGILTLDFLFAFTMIFCFTLLFFSLSLTLTVVEITQYITFASARNVYAAHFDVNTQKAVADAKFAELISHPVFSPFYNNGWFEVAVPPIVGPIGPIIQAYNDPSVESNKFFGVATRFTARVLDFNIPFYGSTAPEGDGTGSGFNTVIATYLGREPNTADCTNFTGNRWLGIRRLPVSGAAPYTTSTSDSGYYFYADNGC